jgi:hypothetical protein
MAKRGGCAAVSSHLVSVDLWLCGSTSGPPKKAGLAALLNRDIEKKAAWKSAEAEPLPGVDQGASSALLRKKQVSSALQHVAPGRDATEFR